MSNNNFVNRIFNGSKPAGSSLANRRNLRDVNRLNRESQSFKKSSNLLVYPEQAADQQHFVVFDIVQRSPKGGPPGIENSTIGAGGVQGIIQGNTRFLGDGLTNLARRNVIKTIALYMPQTIGFTSTINYGEVDVGNITGSLLEARKNFKEGGFTATLDDLGLLQRFLPSTPRAIAQRTSNTAPAAYKDVLFEGIDYRTFNFTFKFTPRNASESQLVKEICETFKYHALPQSTSNLNTSIAEYNLPEEFVMRFYYKDKPNKFIDVVGLCALQSVQVTYGGDKFSTHKDGSPVTTELVLTFRELELIEKNRFKDLTNLRDR